MKKIIPYGKQTIENDDVKIVAKTLKSNYLTTGPITTKFEKNLKNMSGLNMHLLAQVEHQHFIFHYLQQILKKEI